MANLNEKKVVSKNEQTLTEMVAAIMPRQNGTPAGFSALQASLLRGKELVK